MDGRDSVQHMHVCQSVAANQKWDLDDCDGAPAQRKKRNNTSHLAVNYESGLMKNKEAFILQGGVRGRPNGTDKWTLRGADRFSTHSVCPVFNFICTGIYLFNLLV